MEEDRASLGWLFDLNACSGTATATVLQGYKNGIANDNGTATVTVYSNVGAAQVTKTERMLTLLADVGLD